VVSCTGNLPNQTAIAEDCATDEAFWSISVSPYTAIRILASLHAVGVEPDPPEAHPTVVFRDGGPASTPAVSREAAIMRIAAPYN
jgi:hypothetical protein